MKGIVRMADGDVRAPARGDAAFQRTGALPSMPADFGDGVVILVTQDATQDELDQARRRLAHLPEESAMKAIPVFALSRWQLRSHTRRTHLIRRAR